MTPKSTGRLPYLREELPLEPVSCCMCGSADYKAISRTPPFTVARCCGCDFVYVTPRVPESHLHLVYAWDYYESQNANDYGYDGYLSEGELHRRTFTRKADLVMRHKPGGRLLEVGSAGGFFLKEMQSRGFDVEGIEISSKAAAFAREELGLSRIHCGKLEDVSLQGPYDVIALWDVIEHVSNPAQILRRLRELMDPEGIIVMQTQNIDSLAARLMGRRWHHFKHVEHIHHFSPATMRRALAQSGFEATELTTRDAGKYVSGKFIRDRMRRFSRVLYYCLLPFGFLDRMNLYVNLRDEFIVVARPVQEDGSDEDEQ